MGTIKLLPEQLINQIAAGEVVERPVSVVKELIENSMDAGATDITVELEAGGRDTIIVRDNGCGMSEEDLYMALERHATSKINDKSDLFAIKTMGFRGEALPSIASVSNFRIAGSTANGGGSAVSFKSGRLIESGVVSMPRGTEVTVKNLFFNTPARRKFLKSEDKEFALIRELIQKFSILHPAIGFSLFHNGRNSFTYNPGQSLHQRLLSVWKASSGDIAEHEVSNGPINLRIISGSPFQTFSGATITAVNNRIVTDRRINGAVFKALRESMGGDTRVTMLIMIDMPYEEVDVNVHPAKTEVRFRDERAIFTLVESAVKAVMSKFRSFEMPVSGNIPGVSDGYKNSYSPAAQQPANHSIFDISREYSFMPEPVAQPDIYSTVFSGHRVIGTAFSLYIIVEMGDRLYFIDQHASHERITYTKLRRFMENKSGLSQMLIQPEVVRLSPEEMSAFIENLGVFSDTGFAAEVFDDDSIVLRGVPALGVETGWSGLVKDMLNEIILTSVSSAWDEKFLSFIATRACRSSVKQNDTLNSEEISSLIGDINNSETLTCPHGRPFFFVVDKKEIEKKVKRIP